MYRLIDEEPKGFRLIEEEAKPLGAPEELTFAEKYIAPILDSLGTAVQRAPGPVGDIARTVLNNGNARGGVAGRVAQGMADPGVAIAQIGANALPGDTGAQVNRRIAEQEAQYQDARKSAGSEGFDPLRALGGAAITAPLGAAGSGLVRGALVGAAAAGLDPVRDAQDFWAEKGNQVGQGAVLGGGMGAALRGLARVVSPNASTNADVALLRSEGVNPTMGQAAGGWANQLEQKLTSVPILGDAIGAARRRSIDQFNEAAIQRTVKPIGGNVEGIGNEAIAAAGDRISGAYQHALSQVKGGVSLAEPQFISKLTQLEQMATGLSEPMQKVWTRELGEIMRKVSPNGSVLGADLKMVDSRLGKVAAEYRGSADPAQRELGDAVRQLQSIFKEQVGAQYPQVADALKKADSAWSQLVRVENAGKKAVNRDGVFTPGQYNQAVREGDKSTRKRAVARGEALGQDLGSAAQNVLGNTYPDSGTAGRVLSAMGALSTAAIHPAIPAGLTVAAGAYAPPVQNALVKLLTERPEAAPIVANYLRQLVAPATVAAVPVAQEFQ